MMHHCTRAVLASLLFAAAPLWAQEKVYPPAPAPAEKEHLGEGVQRTMTLLASSTPQHRNKVRILFYGQSITEQDWWKRVAEDLRKRFPNADLEIENRAIGGFAAQLLIRPAEHDVYPFYPDLLIFHVYGSNKEYEEIIRSTRARTTAEVLMQKDHVTAWPPENPDPNKDKGLWWDSLMNNKTLPEIAAKHGCALLDIRGPWLAYLKTNNLQPKDLLKDGVHLNDQGCYLMAELVKRYLVYRPELPADAWKDRVRTVGLPKPAGGKWTVEFEGNRIDAIAAAGGESAGPATVLIDGKKPSEFDGCYRISRPTPGPWSPLALARVDHDKPLVLEEWTLTLTKVSEDGKSWEYTVSGSSTGPDGAGSNATAFTSNSGRAKIEPAAFFRAGGKLAAGYQIKWKVLPMFVDSYAAPKVEDPSREYATTLAQGLSNGKHTLEIISADGKPAGIAAVRVYRP